LVVQNAAGNDACTQIALVCANLENVDRDTSHQQVIHASLTSGAGLSKRVTGEATFEIEDGKLVNVATLAGLEPFSTHPLLDIIACYVVRKASITSQPPSSA
jgi:hypothetical protein